MIDKTQLVAMRLTVWRSVQSVVKGHKQRAFSSSYLQKPLLRDAAGSVLLRENEEQTDAQHAADLVEFRAAYPDVERDLTEMRERYADAEIANDWFKQVLQYNMSGGSLTRGLAVVQSYRILAAPEDNTPANIRLAQVMGWCLELLHTSLVLTQDLIDQAKERRGKPCWYLQNPRQAPDGAARMLDYAIYRLLKKYFRKKEYYIDALELFHTVGEKAMLGKVLDMDTRGDPTLSRFDMTTYNTISKYRNAYHSFKLPVSLALYMAGIRDSECHRQSRMIQLEMGNFYQAQSDFFNCYGGGRWDHATPGHDIEDGRCTWLIVVALQRASPAQRQALIDNYGQKDEEKVKRVKEIYDEIGIPHTYKMFEEHSLQLICTQIQQISRGLPHQLFYRYLKTMTGPKFPDRGENVHLSCNFDTGDAKLYSVKWYKDENEFFRYMPDQRPPTQVFPLQGVKLDESQSGMNHVTLRDVTYDTTGSYRCEVSTEAPSFETVFSNHDMSVLSYPQDDPHLTAAQEVYSSGELVLVNCTAPPTYPAPNISFYINNDKTEEWLLERGPETLHEDGTKSTWAALRFHAQRQHFLPPEDVLEVRCDVEAPPLPSSNVRTHLYLATPHSSSNQKLAQQTYRNRGPVTQFPAVLVFVLVLFSFL